MKKTTGLLLLAALFGCGERKAQPAPTEYQQKISRIERAEQEWAAEKKTYKTYSFGYYRRGYYVELDIEGDKVVARCQKTVEGVVTTERGSEIGSNEWGNTPPVTLDEVYTECKRTFKKNPSAEYLITLAGYLVWCDGNFGTSGLSQGTGSIGFDNPRCPSDK